MEKRIGILRRNKAMIDRCSCDDGCLVMDEAKDVPEGDIISLDFSEQVFNTAVYCSAFPSEVQGEIFTFMEQQCCGDRLVENGGA